MKKFYIAILLLLGIGLNFSCEAIEIPFIHKSANAEIRSMLREYSKAMKGNDTKKIKTFYTDDYLSADGFDLDDLTDMVDKTHKAYGEITYNTKINHIDASSSWALVQMSDTSKANIYPDKDKKNKEKMGKLRGRSVYNVYLKKTKDGWKIFHDKILTEETSLTYGVANKIKMDLITPVFVKAGKEYDLSLKMDKPDDIVALASISREEISYPPVDLQEKFRRIPEDGGLERLVRANNKNLDEYAIASIGFTRVSVNEAITKARIEILGMAYIMKRINMEHVEHVKKVKGQTK